MTTRSPHLLLIYGDGGHRAQMQRLLDLGLIRHDDNVTIAAFYENQSIKHPKCVRKVRLGEARSKYFSVVSFLMFPFWVIKAIYYSLVLNISFHPDTVISTGPGLAVVPAFICRLFGAKIIVVEDWCKFEQPTISTRLLAPIAEKLYVQNESLLRQLPQAIYSGRL